MHTASTLPVRLGAGEGARAGAVHSAIEGFRGPPGESNAMEQRQSWHRALLQLCRMPGAKLPELDWWHHD